tara:strand:- start:8056 stop:8214 length:159 start_codon:yes stop_codon:yes gene_type:complete
VKKFSLKDFSLLAVENDVYIAVPIDDDGKFDAKLVFLLGTFAVKENILFDIV